MTPAGRDPVRTHQNTRQDQPPADGMEIVDDDEDNRIIVTEE